MAMGRRRVGGDSAEHALVHRHHLVVTCGQRLQNNDLAKLLNKLRQIVKSVTNDD